MLNVCILGRNIPCCRAIVGRLYCRKSLYPAKVCLRKTWTCTALAHAARMWCLSSALVCHCSAAVFGSVFQGHELTWGVTQITFACMVVTLSIGNSKTTLFVCAHRQYLGWMNNLARVFSGIWYMQIYESAGSWLSEEFLSAGLASSAASWGTSQVLGLPPRTM